MKKLFADAQINELLARSGMMFSSANSINWGRLLPQIVYYFSAYCDLISKGGITREGQEINIVVPTGNFGNILAAYYAKKMGLPVHKLICASNSNNVLTEFLNTGVYTRSRQFYTTLSPSMDILVSSNLERLLFDLTGNDSARVARWMKQLADSGKYQVDRDILEQIRGLFYAGFCDDDATRATIKEIYHSENYLCDTHTAVAVNVYHQYISDTDDVETPAGIASTASPYKFADSVLGAVSPDYLRGASEFAKALELSVVTGTPVPKPIAELESKQVRFRNSCTKGTMGEMVLKAAGIE